MAGTVTASVVKNDTTSPPQFQNSAGTEIGQLCRAWVNFNGVTTATIRASFNVSSVTRNSTGDYTITFTNAMPDANYCPVLASNAYGPGDPGNSNVYVGSGATVWSSPQLSTGSVQVISGREASTKNDVALVCVSIFR